MDRVIGLCIALLMLTGWSIRVQEAGPQVAQGALTILGTRVTGSLVSEPQGLVDTTSASHTLTLDTTGNHELTTSNSNPIDSLVLNANAAGSTVILGDALVSTADFNHDGLHGDLLISASAPLASDIMIDALSLTKANHIVVDGLHFDGNDVLGGGAGDDVLAGGKGLRIY